VTATTVEVSYTSAATSSWTPRLKYDVPVITQQYRSINSPIIPLQNIGHPQESSTALYSWRRTWYLPRSFSLLWPLQAPFFAMYSSVFLCPVCLGGSTLGLVWLCRLSVSAVYGPAIPTWVSWFANLFLVVSCASTTRYLLSGPARKFSVFSSETIQIGAKIKSLPSTKDLNS